MSFFNTLHFIPKNNTNARKSITKTKAKILPKIDIPRNKNVKLLMALTILPLLTLGTS